MLEKDALVAESGSEEKNEEGQDSKGNVVLTDRDLEVMKLIHEHRYSAYNQIKRAFWKDRSNKSNTCYARLERLIKEGYLEKGYVKSRSLYVYFVGEPGYEELRVRGLHSGMKFYRPTQGFDRYADHDMKVLTTRIVFREMGIMDWRGERIFDERLRSFRIPDGVIHHKGFRIAIEFENRTKSQSRYQEIFRYFCENTDYKLLLMIMDNGLREWLIRLDYDIRKVWFLEFPDLLKLKDETLIENKAGSFQLKRIL